ncbi:hypothetical protein HJ526_04235 [Donghicola sp. C2-DW-16]|uniref:HdeD family acid-resistance protein n=1 Tax=Donghicola mangrovi TaxID=2729614 RepID=A0ABX2PAW7_9RHOB|nr:DUF308 domain-containing protein [Donghicola mangrovi]NVO26619.1 hypothetical protein [Donghicola mangrovi]
MPNNTALRIVGFLFCLSGALALGLPAVASLAIEVAIGWLFIFIGTIQIISAAQGAGHPVMRGTVGLGVVSLLLGVVLISAPAAGLQTLTMLVALLFMLSGLLKIAIGRALRGGPSGRPLILSGAVSMGLGLWVLATLPRSAAVTLGLLLGLELLSHGIAALFVANLFADQSER